MNNEEDRAMITADEARQRRNAAMGALEARNEEALQRRLEAVKREYLALTTTRRGRKRLADIAREIGRVADRCGSQVDIECGKDEHLALAICRYMAEQGYKAWLADNGPWRQSRVGYEVRIRW